MQESVITPNLSLWGRVKRIWQLHPKRTYYGIRIFAFLVGLIFFNNLGNIALAVSTLLGFKEQVEVVAEEAVEMKADLEKAKMKVEAAEIELQKLKENQPEIMMEAARKLNDERCANANLVSVLLTCSGATQPQTTSTTSIETPISQPTRPLAPAVVVTPPPVDKPLKIAPSTLFSDGDEVIQKRDESLYVKENNRPILRPSTK